MEEYSNYIPVVTGPSIPFKDLPIGNHFSYSIVPCKGTYTIYKKVTITHFQRALTVRSDKQRIFYDLDHTEVSYFQNVYPIVLKKPFVIKASYWYS